VTEIPDQPYAQSQRSDGAHSWEFDGDDPYIRCAFCGELRDALSGQELRGPDPLLVMMARAEVMVPESAVAEAVAAERERIRQLSIARQAKYVDANHWFHFADLIREQP
jgi:hypothetical protein